MITAPAKYIAAASSQNIVADWLLELEYDDTTPGSFYLSSAERTITNFYDGIVSDWGDIEEEIKLSESSASTSDITITVFNKWNNASGLLSDEVFGGSKKFLNQNVTIRSWLLGCAVEGDCLPIFVGRLVDIKHNFETVTFTIEKRSPWDRVAMPDNRSTENNRVFPAAYGQYFGTISTTASPQLLTGLNALCPIPVNEVLANRIVMRAYPSNEATQNVFYYEKSIDEFVSVDDPDGEASYQGGRSMSAPNSLLRGFVFRNLLAADSNTFINPQNAVDGASGSYASKGLSAADGGDPGGSQATNQSDGLHFNWPVIDGSYSKITIYYQYKIIVNTLIGDSGYARIKDHTLGVDATVAQQLSVGTNTGSNTIDISGDYDGAAPAMIQLKAEVGVEKGTGGGIEIDADFEIYEMYVTINTHYDQTNEPLATAEAVNKIVKLYNDNEGVDQSFTGGAGVCLYPHDIFRDMLVRFTGWDASELNDVLVNGVVWGSSTIDTDRDWACRWWTLEKLQLLEVLERVQFEGGFIWVFDYTDSAIDARIIYVKASYASADADLDGDYLSDLDVSMTPFSAIVTKRTFNYQRHPADDKNFLATNSLTNANRGDYNLEAEENAIEEDIEFLTATGDVDDLLEYYDNIVGEPKVLVTCNVEDPAFWNLQVGDVVQFTNMKYDPYGKAWSSLYMMIVKVKISTDSFTITAREVG